MVGVVLAFALVLSPWAPSLLPTDGPSLGTSPAHAQVQDQDPVENENADQPQTRAPGDECAEVDEPGAQGGAEEMGPGSDLGTGTGADGGTGSQGDPLNGGGDPGPSDDLEEGLGADPSSGVECGMPDGCPSDPDADRRAWEPDLGDPSRCVLVTPTCPPSPLFEAGQPVRTTMPSEEYAGFCEDVVLQTDPIFYPRCLPPATSDNPTRRVIVDPPGLVEDHPNPRAFARMTGSLSTSNGEVGTCRAIVPSRCPDQMHRLAPGDTGGDDDDGDHQRCRQYQRRNWSCPGELKPRNQFNTCYRPATDDSSGVDGGVGHPACGVGAPRFEVSDCEAYVGSDILERPSEFACSGYVTRSDIGGVVTRRLERHAPNDYWCSYDLSWLDVTCHGASPSCAPNTALCIKRASHTGGCTSVANTIRCRALQASNLNVETVQREGCAPCMILPFTEVPSRGSVDRDSVACPDNYSTEPNQEDTPAELELALQRRGSISVANLDNIAACRPLKDGGRLAEYPSCENHKGLETCAPLSLSRLEWKNTAGAGVVVNERVIVDFVTAPVLFTALTPTHDDSTYRYFEFRGRLRLSPLAGAAAAAMVYRPEPAELGAPLVLVSQWPTPLHGPRRARTSVGALMRESGTGCVVTQRPLNQLIVRELWPDTDGDRRIISELFGSSALKGWESLPRAQKEDLTEARGLTFGNENEDRASLQTEVPCNAASDSRQWWCLWVPQRSGYFELTGESAWKLHRWLGRRLWMTSAEWDAANTELAALDAIDGSCADAGAPAPYTEPFTDTDCILEALDDLNVHPYEAGFNVPPEEAPSFGERLELRPLPAGSDDRNNLDNPAYDELYRQSSAHIHQCPSQDIRMKCEAGGRFNTTYSYERTDSIGIVVQEARVVTRQPSEAAGP